MGNLVFIAALAVGVAVMAWYFACEAAGSDGDRGLLALKSGQAGRPDASPIAAGDLDDGGRYRLRERLAPGHRAGLRAAAPQRAYRVKTQGVPAYRQNGESDVEADKDY